MPYPSQAQQRGRIKHKPYGRENQRVLDNPKDLHGALARNIAEQSRSILHVTAIRSSPLTDEFPTMLETLASVAMHQWTVFCWHSAMEECAISLMLTVELGYHLSSAGARSGNGSVGSQAIRLSLAGSIVPGVKFSHHSNLALTVIATGSIAWIAVHFAVG